MFKRPSSRRRTQPQEVMVNLVPMMDALVTMIAFLMYTMAFMSLTMIESPLPIVSSSENEQQLKERPLQLTITIKPGEVLIWSPFELVPSVSVPHKGEQPDLPKIHETLLGIKQKFPRENKVILVPNDTTPYDTIIGLMDAIRLLEKTDPPMSAVNPETGVDEQVKTLFSDVVFGNLLGSGESS